MQNPNNDQFSVKATIIDTVGSKADAPYSLAQIQFLPADHWLIQHKFKPGA